MMPALQRVRSFVANTLHHPTTARHPIATFARIAQWQVESRLRPGIHDKRWIEDARLLVKRGMTGATGNLYFGLHEFTDMAFLLHYLRADDLFLDIGANVGSYSVLAGKLVGARVLAFEPHPETAEWFVGNLRRNAIEDRVTLHRVALSDHEGPGAITDGLDTMNRVVAADAAGSRAVALRTLDGLVGGEAPAMVKIDVEGHEAHVFAGGGATLAKPSLGAIEIETTTPAIEAQLAGAGFVERFYDAFARTLSTTRVTGVSASNRLFVRDPDAVAARVQGARQFAVAGSMI